MTDFTDLREVAENKWQAKYHGNYGVYTVKLTLNAKGERTDFSCSCPSDYYPCKHIAMMEREVAEQIVQNSKKEETSALTVDNVLKHVSLDELRHFVIQQAKYSSVLTNALILEFSHRVRSKDTNPYFDILHEELEDVHFDYEDYYEYDSGFEIDPLNEWLEKAQTCLTQEKYEDALLICQACIEEFVDWFENVDNEAGDYIETDYYETKPFDILQEIIEKTTKFDQKLYDYCKQEIQQSKYEEHPDILDGFNNLMAALAPKINPTEFIALQDSLLKQISDKSSYKAQKIQQRKIDFYRLSGQPDKADEIIENNLQIKDFCRQAVEKRIAKKQYKDAKKLINDYSEKYPSNYHDYWGEYILDIAQKEKDIPMIRKTAYEFIRSHFDKKYYEIFRSTFTAKEWENELENLIQHYENNKTTYWVGYGKSLNFNTSIADVLIVEKATERLLAYLEKSSEIELVEKYYMHVSEQFPERILSLFRKTTDVFAEKNLGRDKYEYIKTILGKMKKIKDGEAVVNEMVAHYRNIYRTRRAMMEVLKSF